jgi:hypothetical protein
MNEILDTRREKRLDDARHVFNDMQRLLTRIMEDDVIPCYIGVDLAEEITGVLDRAALIAF